MEQEEFITSILQSLEEAKKVVETIRDTQTDLNARSHWNGIVTGYILAMDGIRLANSACKNYSLEQLKNKFIGQKN